MSPGFYGGSGEVFGEEMNVALITPGDPAPDFELTDTHGNLVRLSSYRNKKIVVLSFLRGFF
jgi:peroxiredoxin